MWIVIRVKTIQYHSKLKPHPGKDGFDFIQGFAAEVFRFQHFGFGFLDQIPDPVSYTHLTLPTSDLV